MVTYLTIQIIPPIQTEKILTPNSQISQFTTPSDPSHPNLTSYAHHGCAWPNFSSNLPQAGPCLESSSRPRPSFHFHEPNLYWATKKKNLPMTRLCSAGRQLSAQTWHPCSSQSSTSTVWLICLGIRFSLSIFLVTLNSRKPKNIYHVGHRTVFLCLLVRWPQSEAPR